MSEISFNIAPHSVIPGRKIVQILLNGAVIGAIYPDNKNQSIKIVSVHMADKKLDSEFEGRVVDDPGTETFPAIPALHVQFVIDSTWSLTDDGRVFKHTN